jgi:hypothetical protein
MLKTLFDSIQFGLEHYAAMLALASTALLLGGRLTRGLTYSCLTEHLAVSTTAGLGALATALFFMGLAGLLQPTSFIALAGLILITCGPAEWKALRAQRRLPPHSEPDSNSLESPGLTRGPALAVLALLTPTLILALYPPIGYDGLLYHLPYAEFFLQRGSLAVADHLRFPVFPQFHDLLFTLMLALADDVSTKLVEMLSYLLTAALLYCWGRRFYSPRAGLWAAALWLGEPVAAAMGTTTYIDAGLASFSTLALYCFYVWRGEERLRERSGTATPHHDRWLFVAAFAAACAAATKYHGLLICVAVGGLALWEQRRSLRIRPLLVCVIIGLVVAGPTYARITIETGSPVFPFYRADGAPGQSPHNKPMEAYGGQLSHLEAVPYPRLIPVAQRHSFGDTITRFVKLPWDWTMNYTKFPGPHIPFSPAYLLAIPLLLVYGMREPSTRQLLMLAIGYSAVWLLSMPDPRYLLPCLAPLIVCVAASLDRFFADSRFRLGGLARRAASIGCLTVLLPGATYALAMIWLYGPPPLSLEQREEFLSWRAGPGYQAVKLLNETHGDDYKAYNVRAENLQYYARGEYLGDEFGPGTYDMLWPWINTRRAQQLKPKISKPNADGLYELLHELDVSHLLVSECESRFLFPITPSFERDFELILRSSEKYPGTACLYRLRTGAVEEKPAVL